MISWSGREDGCIRAAVSSMSGALNKSHEAKLT
jgi:hypothetical protein